ARLRRFHPASQVIEAAVARGNCPLLRRTHRLRHRTTPEARMTTAPRTGTTPAQRVMALLAGAAGMLLATATPAADAPATETLAIRAAHVFDATGGTLRDNAVVVVQGERITAVGTTVPAGARVIELGEVTLLPGFIDAHTHLTMEFNN